jgi:hypothetical protein
MEPESPLLFDIIHTVQCYNHTYQHMHIIDLTMIFVLYSYVGIYDCS